MYLQSEIHPIRIAPNSSVVDQIVEFLVDLERADHATLRWGLVGQTDQELLLEVASIREGESRETTIAQAWSNGWNAAGALTVVAIVIPTGVGADVGGFVGDAAPLVRAFETVADRVIIHPNVVNAADFLPPSRASFYVDGYTLDQFLEGNGRLEFPHPRRVGLLLDDLDLSVRNKLLNATNAMQAVHGLDIVGYVTCPTKVRAHVQHSDYGHFLGRVENPAVLFEAAELLCEAGAEAIAVVTDCDGITREDFLLHYRGEATNPIGSIEALISRSITWQTGLPCAHAPAGLDLLVECDEVVDPRAASEVASGTGLPCILQGLARAPRLTSTSGVHVRDLSAIIVPFDCAGGAPALSSARFGIPLIGVRSNQCCVGIPLDRLGLSTAVSVANYAEAIGYVACRKSGIRWETIQRPLAPVRALKRSR